MFNAKLLHEGHVLCKGGRGGGREGGREGGKEGRTGGCRETRERNMVVWNVTREGGRGVRREGGKYPGRVKEDQEPNPSLHCH